MKWGKRIVLFTLLVMNLVDQPAPEVKIKQGILRGKISADGSVLEYVGIPYGTTNFSSRFKAPLPPPAWEGVFKAIDEIHQCPQNSVFGVIGNEDCLKINVYVPVTTNKLLPVMVFIHGGTFVLGNGGKLLYGPKFLVQHNIILVTFNYRLGPLGFICLGITEAPGNAGLKDQVAALKWVKENIAAFGGDPENVTIFGLSAGAISVSLLIASETTEGLFTKAIVQSGSGISNWAINRQPRWVASLVAKELGYDTDNPKEIYEIFSKLPYQTLVSAAPKKPLDKFFDTQLLYLPCIEEKIEGEQAVLLNLPYQLFKNNPKNISIIYGTTNKEGMLLLPYDTEESLEERNTRYIFASDLKFPSDDQAMKMSQVVKDFYFKDQNISFEVHDKLLDLYTHLYFEVPTILESEIIILNSYNSIYNYIFQYSGNRNLIKFMNGYYNSHGACHADEILYLFNGNVWPYHINKKDQTIIEWMTKMWTNFAKHGNPTPDGSNLPIKWLPSNASVTKFLYINDQLKMGPIPNPKAYKLWKEIYSRYRNIDILNDFKINL